MVAAAIIGGAIVGGVASNMAANKESKAANNAAQAQLQSSQQAIDEQKREYDQSRADMQPFLQTGYGALDKEKALLNGDYSGFQNSPDYKFTLNQGIGALDKSAAARGSLYSGGHSQDLTNYAEGTADQFLNSYWNKLAGQAGQGQVGAGELGNLGANMAGNIGNYLTNAGNARASSYLQQGNIGAQQIGATANTFNNLLGYYMNRPQSSYTTYGAGFDVNPGQPSATYDYGSVPNVNLEQSDPYSIYGGA